MYTSVENKQLCVCYHIDLHRERTKKYPKKKSQLLLSFIESHKAISTSTVSSWIIEVSGLAGTDKKYFTVHSTQDQLLKQKILGVLTKEFLIPLESLL